MTGCGGHPLLPFDLSACPKSSNPVGQLAPASSLAILNGRGDGLPRTGPSGDHLYNREVPMKHSAINRNHHANTKPVPSTSTASKPRPAGEYRCVGDTRTRARRHHYQTCHSIYVCALQASTPRAVAHHSLRDRLPANRRPAPTSIGGSRRYTPRQPYHVAAATARRRHQLSVHPDHVRRHRCMLMLEKRWLPGKCVAWELGYAEVNSFYRAFRRWTGHNYSDLKQLFV